MNSIFDHDRDSEERGFGGLAWLLALLAFGTCVVVEYVMSFFASPSAGGVAGILLFTVLVVLTLITALNSDNLSGVGKVGIFVFSAVGWMFGLLVLMVLNAVFNHQTVT